MKAFRRNRCIEQLILNLGIRRRWLLSLTPRQLYHLARNPDLHWIGCCVGFRVSLDSVKKRKISYPAGYRVSKCSLCFCPLCRFQVWKIFFILYICSGHSTTDNVSPFYVVVTSENQMYKISGIASMKSANERKSSVQLSVSWWLNMWKISNL